MAEQGKGGVVDTRELIWKAKRVQVARAPSHRGSVLRGLPLPERRAHHLRILGRDLDGRPGPRLGGNGAPDPPERAAGGPGPEDGTRAEPLDQPDLPRRDQRAPGPGARSEAHLARHGRGQEVPRDHARGVREPGRDLHARQADQRPARRIDVHPHRREGPLARAGAPPRGRRGEGLIEETRKIELERTQARGEFSQDQIAVERENLRRAQEAYREAQERIVGASIASGPVDQENLEGVRQLSDAAEKEAEQVSERIRTDLQTWSGRAGSARLPDLRTGRTAELEGRLSSLESSYGAAAAAPAAARERRASCSRSARRGRRLLNEYENAASALPGTFPTTRARSRPAWRSTARCSARSEPGDLACGGWSAPTCARCAARRRCRWSWKPRRPKSRSARSCSRRWSGRRPPRGSARPCRPASSRSGSRSSKPRSSPLKPVWPDRVKVLLGALLLGPLFGVGIIVGAERVGAILRTVEQAEEEMGTKVIGTIPRIEGGRDRDPSSRTTGRRCRFSPCCSSRLW